jgi:hypothetical protein
MRLLGLEEAMNRMRFLLKRRACGRAPTAGGH